MKNSILIIEPNEIDLIEILMSLKNEYEIFYTSKMSEAIDIFEESKPDIVIINIDKDFENGCKIIKYLKTKSSKIPIIATHNNGIDDDRINFLFSLGINDFINKPYKLSVFKVRLMNQIKIINYIKDLESFSLKDKLTDLPNRRSFDITINELYEKCNNEGSNISVFVCDIDHFKKFNDTYGHQVGDIVLKEIGKIIQNKCLKYDGFVSRWGGEEFVGIFINKTKIVTGNILEIIRKEVEKSFIQAGKNKLSVTISIGGVCRNPIDKSIEEIIKEADNNLYEAKETGRNKVINS